MPQQFFQGLPVARLSPMVAIRQDRSHQFLRYLLVTAHLAFVSRAYDKVTALHRAGELPGAFVISCLCLAYTPVAVV